MSVKTGQRFTIAEVTLASRRPQHRYEKPAVPPHYHAGAKEDRELAQATNRVLGRRWQLGRDRPALCCRGHVSDSPASGTGTGHPNHRRESGALNRCAGATGQGRQHPLRSERGDGKER